MADSFGMEFEVTAKTAAAQQGFQGIQAITDQIRSDLNAINDATEGLTENCVTKLNRSQACMENSKKECENFGRV